MVRISYKMTLEDKKQKEEELASKKTQRDLLYKQRAVAISFGTDGENFSNNEVECLDMEIQTLIQQISALEWELSNAEIVKISECTDGIPTVEFGCSVVMAVEYENGEKEEMKLIIQTSGSQKSEEYLTCSPNSPLFLEISGKHIGDSGVMSCVANGYNIQYDYKILDIAYPNLRNPQYWHQLRSLNLTKNTRGDFAGVFLFIIFNN